MTDAEIRQKLKKHKEVVDFKRDNKTLMSEIADDLDNYLAETGTAISSRAIVKAWLNGRYD
mgnify:CR=1 FL=1